jgi:hypothetical protein
MSRQRGYRGGGSRETAGPPQRLPSSTYRGPLCEEGAPLCQLPAGHLGQCAREPYVTPALEVEVVKRAAWGPMSWSWSLYDVGPTASGLPVSGRELGYGYAWTAGGAERRGRRAADRERASRQRRAQSTRRLRA